MRKLVSCVALAVLLGGCAASKPPTRFASKDLTLEVSARLQNPPGGGVEVMHFLDVGTKQVVVEARIVETSRAGIRSIGLWNGRDCQQPLAMTNLEESGGSGLAFGFGIGASSSKGGGGGHGKHPPGCNCAQCRGGGGGGGTSTGAGVGVAFPMDFGTKRVQAAEAVFAPPKVSTIGNQPARLHLVVVTDVDDEEGGPPRPRLVVMPVALESGDVVEAPEKPVTKVLVKDGQTVVIGGLRSEQDATPDKVPVLADIPLLGSLFKNQSAANQKRELMIFVTPRIIPVE